MFNLESEGTLGDQWWSMGRQQKWQHLHSGSSTPLDRDCHDDQGNDDNDNDDGDGDDDNDDYDYDDSYEEEGGVVHRPQEFTLAKLTAGFPQHSDTFSFFT